MSSGPPRCGATLIVTSGCGWVQREGGSKEEIRPGDVVWIPADEKHWHGATATTAMTHIAIAEALAFDEPSPIAVDLVCIGSAADDRVAR